MPFSLSHHVGLRRISTATQGIFKDAGAAKFLTAFGPNSTGLPVLNGLPEVIVTGRANSGKSTLFNAVLGRKDLIKTSSKPGRTRELNFFQVGSGTGHLILVDAPGYGARGRPEWGRLFDQYLAERKELRRVYITFNGKHPLNEYDRQMLEHLSSQILSHSGAMRFTIQAVITKADDLPPQFGVASLRELTAEIKRHAPLCLDPLVTSARTNPPFGIEGLRQNIIEACGINS